MPKLTIKDGRTIMRSSIHRIGGSLKRGFQMMKGRRLITSRCLAYTTVHSGGNKQEDEISEDYD